jgi:hypothetical protein
LESNKYETLTVDELSSSRLRWIVVWQPRLRARLTRIVSLSSVAQVLSLTLTHPPGCTLCLAWCLCQMRSSTCMERTSWRC